MSLIVLPLVILGQIASHRFGEPERAPFGAGLFFVSRYTQSTAIQAGDPGVILDAGLNPPGAILQRLDGTESRSGLFGQVDK